jgi:hypothetical protein
VRAKKVTWERAKLITDVLAPSIATISLVVGGIFAVFQYFKHEQSERAKESLVFVERYYKSPIMDADLRLALAWGKHSAALTNAAKRGGNSYTKFILQTIAAEKLEPSILTMIGFYEGIALCSRNNWCETEMITSFFCDPTQTFFELHYRFIVEKRKQLSNQQLAKEVEHFSRKMCPRPKASAGAESLSHGSAVS